MLVVHDGIAHDGATERVAVHDGVLVVFGGEVVGQVALGGHMRQLIRIVVVVTRPLVSVGGVVVAAGDASGMVVHPIKIK